MVLRAKKKIILVNRDFQLRYAYAAILVGFASTLLTAFVILVPLYYLGILRFDMPLPTPIIASMVFASIVNIAVIGVFGVYLTHRVAGPMYSLVREMRRVGLGGWGQVLKTRETDDIQFLVRNFNEMTEGLVNMTREDIVLLDQCAELPDDKKSEALSSLRQRFEARLVNRATQSKIMTDKGAE